LYSIVTDNRSEEIPGPPVIRALNRLIVRTEAVFVSFYSLVVGDPKPFIGVSDAVTTTRIGD